MSIKFSVMLILISVALVAEVNAKSTDSATRFSASEVTIEEDCEYFCDGEVNVINSEDIRGPKDPISVYFLGGVGAEYEGAYARELRIGLQIRSDNFSFAVEGHESRAVSRNLSGVGFITGWTLAGDREGSIRLIIGSGFSQTYDPGFGTTGGLFVEGGIGGYRHYGSFELIGEARIHHSKEAASTTSNHQNLLIGLAWRFR